MIQKVAKYLQTVVIKTLYKFEKFEACGGFFFFKFLIGYNGTQIKPVKDYERKNFKYSR